MLDEIAWTSEFLAHEFIARAHGEADAFAYLRGTWGDEYLETVFPGFLECYEEGICAECDDDGPECERKDRYDLLARAPLRKWADLLRPDPEGARDSYWGLRVLAEHGALHDRAMTRTSEGSLDTLIYQAVGDTPAVTGTVERWRTIPNPDAVLPEARFYYLQTGGRYVVRTAQSVGGLWSYHGPLPEHCVALPTEEEGDASYDFRYGDRLAPDRRFGWGPIAFYGWRNIRLHGCEASISFDVPDMDEPSTNPFLTVGTLRERTRAA